MCVYSVDKKNYYLQNMKLSSDEQIDDLLLRGLLIIQKKGCFRYGTDAVVLSDFAAKYIKKGSSVLDIGTGTGILPILLSAKTEAETLTGLEIQKEMAELAERSVILNENIGAVEKGRIIIKEGDIKKAKEYFASRSFDAIVTNPPYKRKGAGILNDSSRLNIARHEIYCVLADIVQMSAYLLKSGGSFMMVNHIERLVDTIEEMRKNRIEPKELQFVYSDITAKPLLFLVHGVLFGGKNLIVEKNLVINKETEVI